MIIKSHTNTQTFDHDYYWINGRLVRKEKRIKTAMDMKSYFMRKTLDNLVFKRTYD